MEPQVGIQNWPIYVYGDEILRFVRLYLKDRTVYNVTDYWLVDGQLHFKTIERMVRNWWSMGSLSISWICRRPLM